MTEASMRMEARSLELLLQGHLIEVCDVVAWADRRILRVAEISEWLGAISLSKGNEWLAVLDLLRVASGRTRDVPDLVLGLFSHLVKMDQLAWRYVATAALKLFPEQGDEEFDRWRCSGFWVWEQENGCGIYDMKRVENDVRVFLQQYETVDHSELGVDTTRVFDRMKVKYFI